MTNWSRCFDDPIKTPDGKTLRTLKNAAEYVLALPKKVQAKQGGRLLTDAVVTNR